MAEIYRELSRHPTLSTACIGPDVTTQYGGKYCSLYTGTGMGCPSAGLSARLRGHSVCPHPAPLRVVTAGPGAGRERQVLPPVPDLPRRGLCRLLGARWHLF